VINRIIFLTADFGLGNDQQKAASASKSVVLSLFLSLHKQRKEMHKIFLSSQYLSLTFSLNESVIIIRNK